MEMEESQLQPAEGFARVLNYSTMIEDFQTSQTNRGARAAGRRQET